MHVKMLERTGFRIQPYFMTFLISKTNGEDLTTHTIRQKQNDFYSAPQKFHLETTVMSLLRLTNTIYFQEWKRCFPQSAFIYFLYKEILRALRKSSSIFSSSSSSHQMLCKTLWKLGFKVNNMWKWQNYFSFLLFSCELIDTRSKHVDIATF